MGWLYDEFYIIIAVVEELITEGRLSGTLSGLNEGKPVYIPAIYSQAQKAWVHSFYTQNGYLEYDALIRIGLSEPRNFISTHFQNEGLVFLKSCAVGNQLINQIEAVIEEALNTGSWVDALVSWYIKSWNIVSC